jgi:hypothetical protein
MRRSPGRWRRGQPPDPLCPGRCRHARGAVRRELHIPPAAPAAARSASSRYWWTRWASSRRGSAASAGSRVAVRTASGSPAAPCGCRPPAAVLAVLVMRLRGRSFQFDRPHSAVRQDLRLSIQPGSGQPWGSQAHAVSAGARNPRAGSWAASWGEARNPGVPSGRGPADNVTVSCGRRGGRVPAAASRRSGPGHGARPSARTSPSAVPPCCGRRRRRARSRSS